MKNINNKKIDIIWLNVVLVYLCFCLISCKKMVEIDLPVDQSTAESIFSNGGTAASAMTGIYASMRNSKLTYGDYGLNIGVGMLSDEILRADGAQFGFQINDIDPGQEFIWADSYRIFIYRINSIISGLSNNSNSISESTKRIILGEAKFMRAYIYFNLVNYYGDVPLVLTTSLNTNVNIGRASKAKIYDQIISDLQEAQSSLTDDYLTPSLVSTTPERVRPNKAAATALLAKAYLFTEQWQNAEKEADKLIANSKYSLKSELNEVFLKNSSEAIWQLQPQIWEGGGSSNVADAADFLIPFPNSIPNYVLTPFLLNSFESADMRKSKWISIININSTDYAMPYKYKVGRNYSGGTQSQSEYLMLLRLAEQYLIRAEARARQGNITGPNSAETDLNVIRNRAGLPNVEVSNELDMLNAILQERRVELFLEGGNRWIDLKRTGKINEVMEVVCPAKGGIWQPFKALFPIPLTEIQYNPALKGHQNPGYSEP